MEFWKFHLGSRRIVILKLTTNYKITDGCDDLKDKTKDFLTFRAKTEILACHIGPNGLQCVKILRPIEFEIIQGLNQLQSFSYDFTNLVSQCLQ